MSISIVNSNNVSSINILALDTAAHLAVKDDQLEVLRMLAQHGFNFKAGEDLKNSDG